MKKKFKKPRAVLPEEEYMEESDSDDFIGQMVRILNDVTDIRILVI